MNGDNSSIIDFGINKSKNKFYNNTAECYFIIFNIYRRRRNIFTKLYNNIIWLKRIYKSIFKKYILFFKI
jgi:hypothetical protein